MRELEGALSMSISDFIMLQLGILLAAIYKLDKQGAHHLLF
jgi:hypothetical protein